MEWTRTRREEKWLCLSYLAAFAISSHPGIRQMVSPDSINPMKTPEKKKVSLEYVATVIFGEDAPLPKC